MSLHRISSFSLAGCQGSVLCSFVFFFFSVCLLLALVACLKAQALCLTTDDAPLPPLFPLLPVPFSGSWLGFRKSLLLLLFFFFFYFFLSFFLFFSLSLRRPRDKDQAKKVHYTHHKRLGTAVSLQLRSTNAAALSFCVPPFCHVMPLSRSFRLFSLEIYGVPFSDPRSSSAIRTTLSS